MTDEHELDGLTWTVSDEEPEGYEEDADDPETDSGEDGAPEGEE